MSQLQIKIATGHILMRCLSISLPHTYTVLGIYTCAHVHLDGWMDREGGWWRSLPRCAVEQFSSRNALHRSAGETRSTTSASNDANLMYEARKTREFFSVFFFLLLFLVDMKVLEVPCRMTIRTPLPAARHATEKDHRKSWPGIRQQLRLQYSLMCRYLLSLSLSFSERNIYFLRGSEPRRRKRACENLGN